MWESHFNLLLGIYVVAVYKIPNSVYLYDLQYCAQGLVKITCVQA